MSKKDAYYFSHDSNAQDDPKCMILIDQLGMEGYGIFWALIERLRNEKDYTLPINLANAFAKRWQTSKEKVEAVIKNYGLFVVENDIFYSERLRYSMIEKSEKARISVSCRKDRTTVQRPYNDRTTTDLQKVTNKVKESKGKKSKINNTIQYPFASIDFKNAWEKWKEYKRGEHKFSFKTGTSEQIALKGLYEKAKGNEQTAIRIIDRSIENGWKGLFEIHEATVVTPKNKYEEERQRMLQNFQVIK
jgi:hypothetical protein